MKVENIEKLIEVIIPQLVDHATNLKMIKYDNKFNTAYALIIADRASKELEELKEKYNE